MDKRYQPVQAGLFVLIFSVLLTACGGGGGGGSSGTVISTSSFSASAVMANLVNNGFSRTLNVTGTMAMGGASYPISGSLSINVSPAVASNFEGQTALMSTISESANITVMGSNLPTISTTSRTYSTSNYVPLGEEVEDVTGGQATVVEYCVMQGNPAIPSSVKVNDAGVIGTYNCYSDSTKTILLGTTVLSYVVEADTAESAILDIVNQEYDNSNVPGVRDEERWRMDTSGAITFVSDTGTESGIIPINNIDTNYTLSLVAR